MKYLILIVVSLIITVNTYCQSGDVNQFSKPIELPSLRPKSPEAASIMKAVLYPVNYSTGLPDVEIPIYEIKLKDGTIIPIKLSYHASGYKPSEVKQRIGIGWTLIAEPQITRSVNGEPDEDYFLTHYNHNELVSINRNRVEAIYGGGSDFQPDHFFYKLINKSGKFISESPLSISDLNNNRFFTVPYAPIKITGDPTDNFSINDNGYCYTFSNQNIIYKPKIAQTSYTSYFLSDYHTVYKADKIVSPLNETVEFHYSNIVSSDNSSTIETTMNENSYEVFIEEPMIHNHSGYCSESGSDGWNMNLGYGDQKVMSDIEMTYSNMVMNNQINSQFKALLKVVKGTASGDEIYLLSNNGLKLASVSVKPYDKYFGIPSNYQHKSIENISELTEILFPGGKIEFHDKQIISGEYNVLDYILVKDLQNNIIKKVQLLNHIATTDKPRALLDKVLFLSANDILENNYQFEYFTDPSELGGTSNNSWRNWYSENAMPQFFMPVMYKNAPLNYNIVPNRPMDVYEKRILYNSWELGEDKYTPDRTEAETYEDSYFDYRNEFVLKKVIYPTGGSCNFFYGPSRFEKPDSTDEGIKLAYYYPDGIRIKKIEYKDKDGTLYSRKRYKYGKNESGSGIPFLELKPEDFIITENKKYHVVEYDKNDRHDKLLYKQIYLAKPVVNPYYDVGPSVLYDEVAEYTDNLNDPTKSIKTIYKYDLSKIESVRPYRYTFINNSSTIYTPIVSNDLNQWEIGKLTSVQSMRINTANQYEIISQEDYKYKTIHHQAKQPSYIPYSLQSEEVISYVDLPQYQNFWGRILQKAEGFKDSPVNSPLIVLPEPTNSLIFDQSQGVNVLEEEKKLLDGVLTTKKYIYDETLKHINPKEMTISVKETTNIVSKEKYTYSGDTESDPLFKRNMLDVLLTKETWKENQMIFKLKNNYWFYNNGEAITDINNIPTSAFPALKEISVGQNDNNMEIRLKYKNYDTNGNPVYISKDEAKSIIYLWSYKGKYPVAIIENASYDEVSSALYNQGMTIGQLSSSVTPDMTKIEALRNDNILKNALITTMTYKPLTGMDSQTSPNGLKTFYEYDIFGRLSCVKNADGKLLKKYDFHYVQN